MQCVQCFCIIYQYNLYTDLIASQPIRVSLEIMKENPCIFFFCSSLCSKNRIAVLLIQLKYTYFHQLNSIDIKCIFNILLKYSKHISNFVCFYSFLLFAFLFSISVAFGLNEFGKMLPTIEFEFHMCFSFRLQCFIQ